MKEAVEDLQKNTTEKENDVIKEILERQKVVEDGIASNADALSRIDKEIDELSNKLKVTKDGINNQNVEKETGDELQKDITSKRIENEVSMDIIEKNVVDVVKVKNRRRCRYYNRGFCKHTINCRYGHADKICQRYLETQTCNEKQCSDRHPKLCKWLKTREGCKRQNCDYLHCKQNYEESVKPKMNEVKEYKCESCKYAWERKDCVVKHVVENMEVYFCLNCEDWVQYKQNVFKQGWSLFDKEGFLRTDI